MKSIFKTKHKRKGRQEGRPQYFYLKRLKEISYFFSTFSRWIANLGVVPLFLLSAFLFEPIFFSLFLLLLRVTAVFETIFNLLSYHNNGKYHLSPTTLPNLSYLPTDWPNVKILFLIMGLSLNLYSVGAVTRQNKKKHNILISIGEHREIPINRVQNFTIGNKDIISYKISPLIGHILIKGKKLGFSELVIWDINGKRTYQIYVLSKQHHLKLLHAAQTIQSLGLSTKLNGPLILANGTLKSYNDYLLIHKIYKKYPESFFFKGKFSTGLKSTLLKKVTMALPNHELHCEEEGLFLTCLYSKMELPKGSKKLIKDRYKIILIPKESEIPKNYLLKIKLMNLEKQDGSEFGAGLEGLSGSFLDLYKKDFKSFLLQNKFFFKGKNLDLNLLAEPESIIQPTIPLKIKIGNEIPIEKKRSVKQLHLLPEVEWKFAGLDLNLLLRPRGKAFQLKFKLKFSSLSSRTHQSFTGSQESSSATLYVGKPLQLFEIGIKTTKTETNFFPWLQDIPILGLFFRNKSTSNHYKKVSAIVLLKKVQ